jgi:hypothetical protein
MSLVGNEDVRQFMMDAVADLAMKPSYTQNDVLSQVVYEPTLPAADCG